MQHAATTTGSAYLLKASPQSKVIPFSPLRNEDGSGYTVKISAPVDFSDLHNEVEIATRMNQIVEKEITRKQFPSICGYIVVLKLDQMKTILFHTIKNNISTQKCGQNDLFSAL